MSARASQHNWRTFTADVLTFSTTFGLATIAALLYIVVAGRTLSAHEFGVFNALLGVMTVASYLATSLQVAATQAAAWSPFKSCLARVANRTWRLTLLPTVLVT